jgi:hypothetical protein
MPLTFLHIKIVLIRIQNLAYSLKPVSGGLDISLIYCKIYSIKKAPDFSEAFVLVAGTGLEPVTFGL